MKAIIQERLKKINSQIKKEYIMSIFITVLIFMIFTIYINSVNNTSNKPLIYNENSNESNNIKQIPIGKTDIFASINGKTYTFAWCSGANKIKEENKIFFSTESEAQASGRTLSKLCK